MNILVTGGAGFIGSHFIIYMLNKHKNIHILNLDKLTYAGNLENVEEVMNHPRHTFVQGDICNRELVESLLRKYHIEGIVHFAAESHVDYSISNPRCFVETNVLGTFTLLEAARRFWLDGNNSKKKNNQYPRFHHISTDEVYGSLGPVGYFTEQSPYAPNSPYSASKASSDMLVRSYFQTYGMNVVTTNCSNNYGPKQHDEKLIPTIIRNALNFRKIPIYGDGKNVRDWLFVIDHCMAIEKVFFEGQCGDTYLIGGNNEISNIEIAELICDTLDSHQPILNSKCGIIQYRQLIEFVQDRSGHDFRYGIDDTKIRQNLGVKMKYAFDQGIKETITYYVEKYKKNNLSLKGV